MNAHRSARPVLRLAVAIALATPPLAAQDPVPARADYAATAALLTRFIDHEMADKDLPAPARPLSPPAPRRLPQPRVPFA